MKNKNPSHPHYEIPKTISQSIYNYLKKSIIENKLKAKEKINEKEIADIFEVSRTPVREALARLAAERFIEINYHREAVVRDMSIKELREIYQVIGNLDNLVMDLLEFDSFDEKDFSSLGKMTLQMEQSFREKKFEKFAKLNIDFHKKIWTHNHNAFLHEVLQFCIVQIKRYCYLLDRVSQDSEFFTKSLNEHKYIIDSIKNKDRSKLKALVLTHWVPPSLINYQQKQS